MNITKFGIHNVKSKSVQGPRGIGFKLTETGDFDLENKRLTNIG